MTPPVELQPERAAVQIPHPGWRVRHTSIPNAWSFDAFVLLKKLSETAVIPTYATEGAAGMDLVADEHQIIPPGGRVLVKTNIAIALPKHFEAQVRPRSGLALKQGVTVLNSPGTIDPDYRGGIGVILLNTGLNSFSVAPGDRVAQLVIAPFFRAQFTEVESLDVTERGEGGFGSTGIAA